MTKLKAIEIIENEILCLNRRAANKCNGGEDCATCVLVLPDTLIRQAYAMAIERLKSSDVAPVVHGHWILVNHPVDLIDWEECSVCGYENFYFSRFKFCPNCGAKMEREGNA